MDRDRVASAALDHDGPAEEGADRRRLHVEPATQQGEPGELRLQVRGAPIELGAPVDEEADHAPLERDRIDPAELEGGQAGGRGGVAERRQSIVACVPFDQEDGRYAGVRERDDQVVDLGWAGRDDGKRRRRDDRQVAGLEGVECRHPRLEDPHPADLALAPLERQVIAGDRSCRREQRPVEVVERGHRGGRAADR